MIRKLGLGISALALLVPSWAFALGVGNYELHSYLNQPLSMDISLSGAEDLAPEDIIVNLASQQEFDNAGVNRAAMLAGLKFKIELKGDGTGEIHISTDDPVSEPYMDFLVQILWPTGRILREYTILLDPPSYGSSASAPAVSTPATSAPQTVTTQPTPATVSAGGSQPAQPAASVSQLPAIEPVATGSSSQSYTVKQGDTLWRIASQYRPSSNVSIQQMLIAIEKANPEAFYVKGNANFVNSGAVLRIPDESTVRQYDTRDAMENLAKQNRHWRELLAERGISVPTSEQINAGSNQVQRGTGGSNVASRGEVKLLAGEEGTGAGGSGSEDKAQLDNQLALKAENVDRLTQENQELSSRIDALKQQIVTSDKLLKLRNDQIVALQDKLRELQKQGAKVDPALLAAVDEKVGQPASTGAVVAPVVNPAPATAESAEKAAEAPADAKPEANASAPQAESKPVAKPAPVVKPKPVKTEEPQGLMASIGQFVSQNLMLVGGVLLLIVLLLAALVMRSRKQAAEEAAFDDEYDDQDADGDDFISGGLMADGEDGHQEVVDAVDGDAEDAGTQAEDKNAQDPLDELDVYIAYGRFPQAIDFLRNEIERAPHRTDLKVRLLEVEKEAGDDNAFTKDAARFAGDEGEIDACIARLGGVATNEEPSLDDLESDLSLNDLSAPADDSTEQSDVDAGLDDLGDFNLGEEPLADLDTDIKVSARDDKPVDFSSDKEEPAQPEEAFELDDAFTLDESELPDGMKEGALSDADVSAMDSDDQGLDLSADFDLDDAAPAADDLSLDLPDDEPAHADTELSLDDLEEDAPAEVHLEEEAPIQAPVSASRDDDLDLGGDDDFAFLGDTDENATKLDLARAYIDMGDHEGAKDILNEVISEGNDQQQSEARELLSQVG